MNKKWFTLVELMVVIAIIAILAVGSVTGYSNYLEKAELSKWVQFEKNVRNTLSQNIGWKNPILTSELTYEDLWWFLPLSMTVSTNTPYIQSKKALELSGWSISTNLNVTTNEATFATWIYPLGDTFSGWFNHSQVSEWQNFSISDLKKNTWQYLVITLVEGSHMDYYVNGEHVQHIVDTNTSVPDNVSDYYVHINNHTILDNTLMSPYSYESQ